MNKKEKRTRRLVLGLTPDQDWRLRIAGGLYRLSPADYVRELLEPLFAVPKGQVGPQAAKMLGRSWEPPTPKPRSKPKRTLSPELQEEATKMVKKCFELPPDPERQARLKALREELRDGPKTKTPIPPSHQLEPLSLDKARSMTKEEARAHIKKLLSRRNAKKI